MAPLAGMVALTKSQHDQFLSQTSETKDEPVNLDFDTIVKSASHSGYDLIKREDLIEMQNKLENPSKKV